MTKIFYDRLLSLEKIDKEIKRVAKSRDERNELWALVDEIVHHKAIGCILDKLPRENHEEFLEMFRMRPHDEEYLFEYLRKKIGENIEELIEQEIGSLGADLLKEIRAR